MVGLDISERMIDLARAQEAKEPFGIEYWVEDAGTIVPQQDFDLAIAAWLLVDAHDRTELACMCRRGGRRFLGGSAGLSAGDPDRMHPRIARDNRPGGFAAQLQTMATTTNEPPCHHRGAGPLIFALLALPLATHGTLPVSTALATSPVPRATVQLRPLTTHYPKRCKGSSAANSGPSGVCLLASTSPKASGEFRVRPVSAPGQTAADQPLPVNTILALPPGNSEIFKATGIDNPNTAKITVRENQVETVKTMTLRFVKTKPTATQVNRAAWPRQLYLCRAVHFPVQIESVVRRPPRGCARSAWRGRARGRRCA